jgi:hypothetical protein
MLYVKVVGGILGAAIVAYAIVWAAITLGVIQ